MPFDEQALAPRLPALETPARWWLAYSGGLDSHVLLHAIAALLNSHPHAIHLGAIHVNHGLSPHADAWQQHCQAVCRDLDVELHTARVHLAPAPGESLESRARRARYQVYEDFMQEGDWLLLAHHQDDQAETQLYRLLRGAGPRGLAGIPAARPLGPGRLLRPLLEVPRAELLAYARRRKLRWIEDESNRDPAIDRNYLRQRVMPALEERWPGFRQTWTRSAELCGEAAEILREVGRADLRAAATPDPWRLEIAPLAGLSEPRLRNALRQWFDELNASHGLPLPGHLPLRRLVREVLPAAEDACPRVSWRHEGRAVEVRRHAGCLYALRPLMEEEGRRQWQWRPPESLQLGEALGRLCLVPVAEGGLALAPGEALEVSFRQGGERVRPAGGRSRPLKKILQEAGVPPWLRDRVPLIHRNGDLVAVGDLLLCEGARQGSGDSARERYRIRWERSDIHCGW